MKNYVVCLACTLLFCLAVWGCGSESETVNDTYHDRAFVYGDSSAFGKVLCDGTMEGRLAFVREESRIYYCAGSTWRSLNGLNGRDGGDGVDGANGKDGQKGRNGIDGTDCSIYKFADGYVLVCGETSAQIRMNVQVPDFCTIVANGNTDYKLTCGKESFVVNQGVPGDDGLDCVQTDLGNGYVSLACDNDTLLTAKALCGESAYDPEGNLFCYDGQLVDRCRGKVYDVLTQNCLNGNVVQAE